MKIRRSQRLSAYIVVLAALGWVWYPIAQGRLPGDLGDARLALLLMWHWVGAFHGSVAPNDGAFFAPIAGTMGYSDGFLAQGLVFAGAMASGFGAVLSFVVAVLVIWVIGAAGVAELSLLLFRTTAVRVAFIALVCAGYPSLERIGHVQFSAHLLGAWVLVGLWWAYAKPTRKMRGIGLFVACGALALIMLSSYYTFVFFGTFVVYVVMAVVLLSVVRRRGLIRSGAHRIYETIATVFGIVGIAILASAGMFFLYLYRPAQQMHGERTWDQVAPFVIDARDWVTQSVGGPIAYPWTRYVSPTEQAMGYSSLVIAAVGAGFIGYAIARWRSPEAVRTRHRLVLPSLILAIVAFHITFVNLTLGGSGVDVFKFMWNTVPALNVIRAPGRSMLLGYVAAIALGLWAAERAWIGIRTTVPAGRRRLLGAGAVTLLTCVSALIMVGDIRPDRFRWTGGQLFPQTQPVPGDCRVLVLADRNDVSRPPWVYELDAVALARRMGLSTANGYSGIAPVGYPASSTEAPGLTEAVERIRWALSNGSGTTPCIVEYDSGS